MASYVSTFTGDGSDVTFTAGFPVLRLTDLAVVVDGTWLTLGVDYVVGGSTGAPLATLTVAPDVGSTVTLRSAVGYTPTDPAVPAAVVTDMAQTDNALWLAIAALQIACGLPEASPAAYYVDSVSGSDSNDGTTPQRPFQTISKLVAADGVGPRSSWMLASGSTWREAIIVPRDGMKVESYGEGTRPLLDCSGLVLPTAWSKSGGYASVYQATVALDVAGAVTPTWVSAWESGTRMVRASSVANCDATPNSYFPSSDSAASITLYVHASDGSNPGTGSKFYEYSRRVAGLDSRGAIGVQHIGIWTRRQLGNDGSLVMGKYGYAENCLATEGSKHNVYSRTGSQLVNCEAVDRYYPALSDSLFVFNENTPAGEGISYTGCYAHSTAPDGAADGFYGHYNTSGSFGSVKFKDCNTKNLRRGIYAEGGVGAVTVDGGSHIANTSAHIFANTSLSVTGTTFREAGNYNVWMFAAGITLTLDRVVSDGKDFYGDKANQTITATNSVFGPTDIPLFLTGSGCTVNAHYNTFGLVTQQYIFCEGTVNADHNSYVTPAARGNYAFRNGGNYYSWAAWQALPKDAASVSIASLTVPISATLLPSGSVGFSGVGATGAGAASLGANSPAGTLTSPYTWLQATAPDGSVGWVPLYK